MVVAQTMASFYREMGVTGAGRWRTALGTCKGHIVTEQAARYPKMGTLPVTRVEGEGGAFGTIVSTRRKLLGNLVVVGPSLQGMCLGT